jgi:hypothetical protein
MARVLTFSRRYPIYHPKKGELTRFVEKFWRSGSNWPGLEWLQENNGTDIAAIKDACDTFLGAQGKPARSKGHTIREGTRFIPGMVFSPRVWSEGAYHSPQIKIGPDTVIIKTYGFKSREGYFFLDNVKLSMEAVAIIAANDGLTLEDFLRWFKHPKAFDGQVIIWDETIDYSEFLKIPDKPTTL